ncbi:MAG: 6-hydroxymethylpterin diphosphokinase MptE-like protein [Thermodesulfobacteriota bacterium]|nr:6-hydroxymethylpterin diphosphokinase MptE-like protein [Thermodesulfobacteriota bacterium]
MGILEKNFDALKGRSPDVFKWLNTEKQDDRVEMVVSNDNWNLRIRGKKGKSFLLYDMDDVFEESRKHFKDIDFTSDRVTFILGFGLGYGAKAILERMGPGHKVVVLENNPTILRLAFTVCDFSEPIRNAAISFFLTDDDSIKRCAAAYATNKLREDLVFVTNTKLREVDKEYIRIEKSLTEATSAVLIGVITGLRNAQTFVINDLWNFPKFLFSSGIRNLSKKFENMPGIIVSAGPSLEKNIHNLKMAQGKAVIFATAPVVRIMLAYDIVPDFVVSIDFLEQNHKHFEGICALDIPLIHPCTLYHKIVRDYQGDGFVYQDASGITGWLKEHWPFKGMVIAGGSVALHAFVAAALGGCDPIILVGQDLAFSKKTHVEGAALATDVDTSKDNKELIWIEGMYGEKVPSFASFVTHLRRFEDIIASIENKCIDSTEGGALIKGTEIIPLRESIEKYCREDVDISSIIEQNHVIEPVDYLGIIKDLQDKIQEVKRIYTQAGRGLKSNKEIAKRIKNGNIGDTKTDKVLLRNYDTSTEVQEFCEGFLLTSSFLRKEILEINRSNYQYESDQFDRKEEIEVGLKRNRMILTASRKVLKRIRSMLNQLLETADEIAKTRDAVLQNEFNSASHHKYGKLLAQMDLHRPAIKEYLTAIRLEDSALVHLDLARSYIVLEKIEEARHELEKYLGAGGKNEDGAKLNDEIEQQIMRWSKLAQDHYTSENWINALLYARKVIKSNSRSETAMDIISNCIEKRNEKIRRMEKMKDRDRVDMEREKAFDELISKGKESMNNRYLDEAVGLFQEAITNVPPRKNVIEAQSLLGCCFAEKNEMVSASEVFQDLMKKHPYTGIFNVNLARGYLRNGFYEQAIKEYESAISKEQRFYFLYFEIGSIYMKYGEYGKAIEAFERYLESSPDSYELVAKIGTCYLAKGMPWKAKIKYQEALKIQPEFAVARLGLSKIEELERRMS